MPRLAKLRPHISTLFLVVAYPRQYQACCTEHVGPSGKTTRKGSTDPARAPRHLVAGFPISVPEILQRVRRMIWRCVSSSIPDVSTRNRVLHAYDVSTGQLRRSCRACVG
eukprot:605034-Rhodomonas_salina.1